MMSQEPDTQLFLLWDSGRFAEKVFLASLEREFEVLRVTEFQWTRAKTPENLSRLYCEDSASSKGDWIGYGPFLCALVRDHSASYDLRMTLSGKVKYLNTNVLRVKQELRQMTFTDVSPINVHSTVDRQEFKENFALLFGPDNLLRVIADDSAFAALPARVDSDLAGSEGWDSIENVLNMLCANSEFALLRPRSAIDQDHILRGGDIDILLRDRSKFRFMVNSLPRDDYQDSRTDFVCLAGGQRLKFDIREVGDGDLDPAWQTEILDKRTLKHPPLVTISEQDLLPYLIYHNFVQLNQPKEKYINWISARCEEILGRAPSGTSSAELAWIVLIGFMREKGFKAAPASSVPGFGSSRRGLARLPSDLGGRSTPFSLRGMLAKFKLLRWVQRLRRHDFANN